MNFQKFSCRLSIIINKRGMIKRGNNLVYTVYDDFFVFVFSEKRFLSS